MSRSDTLAVSDQATWRDYLEVCKPRVVALMLLTAVVGMLLATPGMVPLDVLLFGNLGIGLCAAAAAAINHLLDRSVDARMARTAGRPVASGRLPVVHTAVFAALLGGGGAWMLVALVNPLTAWLTLASMVGYAFIYTLFLKRATPQNIVIGGLAGATPPLLGWTAVTGSLDPQPLLLVLIIFAWTPPHFWALAIHRRHEYAMADIPMLPVTHGEEFTKLQILLYTLVMVAASLLPFALGLAGWLYFVSALALGLGFLYHATVLKLGARPSAAMDTFNYSIYYLGLLFVLMLTDHYLAPVLGF